MNRLSKGQGIINISQKFLPRVQKNSSHTKNLPKHAGRFTVPLSHTERLLMKLKHMAAELNDKTLSTPISPAWQAVTNYLFRKNILHSPTIVLEPPFNDEPKLFYAHFISHFDESLTSGHRPNQNFSRGTSLDFEEAISKALGELLERYPLALYSKHNLLRSSVAALEKKNIPHLNPSDLAGFSDAQKKQSPERVWDESSEFSWIWGTRLSDNSKILLPAQNVFWNYCRHSETEEPYLCQPITNGASGHFSKEEALIGGILELVQRDAFLIHWLNKIPPPQIKAEKLKHPQIQKLLAVCKRYSLEPIIFNTSLDINIPAVAVAVRDKTLRGPAITMGGGCDFTFENAIIRGIIEALGVRHWVRRNLIQTNAHYPKLPIDYIPFQEEIGQEKRILLWANPAMLEKFDFFLKGPSISPPENPDVSENIHNRLQFLQKNIESHGPRYMIYYYKAEHYILSALGFHSLRVIIPPLVPLYMKENSITLGASRIRSTPQNLGLKSPNEPNPLPHPFP